MPKYKVRAEFVDIHTGKRILPGADPFEPHDEDQYDRLVAANCIAAEAVLMEMKAIDFMTRSELETAALEVVRAEMGSASDDDLRAMIQRFRDKASEGIPLAKWKVDDLKALAAKEEIDLGDATKKDDIIAAIELARESKDA